MKVAIIPARGGSKRIPRKNIKPFCGKPMIGWSIQAALDSGCFDRVVVSTDDAEIAEIAKDLGAEAPFLRPENLSDDNTATAPVIHHAIKALSSNAAPVSHACCIYATAPFVRPADIRAGLTAIDGMECDFAFSVTSYAFPIQRALRISAQGRAEMFSPEYRLTRSQDLEEAFHDAGQFYWGTADAWLNERPIFGPASVPVFLPRHRVQDIDTPEDWTTAERMFAASGDI